MELQESAGETLGQATAQARQVAEKAGQTLKSGYEAAQKLVNKGLEFDAREMVRREPWLALAAAFALGYLAAQVLRRVS